MQKYLRIFIILFCITSSAANATHIMSAELTYQYIGNNKYVFTLTAYRDCASNIPLNDITIDYSSVSCKLQGTFPLRYNTQLVEVSTACPGDTTDCTISGYPNKGYQRYVFQDTFQLAQKCADWVFSWQSCNRNTAINTISNPGLTCLYVQSTLNNTFGPVSSPQFTDPNIYIPWRDTTTLDMAATVVNADSLQYSFITPKSSATQNVSYLTTPIAFSASNFLQSSAPISLNASTGIISNVAPTVVAQTSVTGILVKQYKNGVVVGTVERDIEVIVFNNNNIPPVLSGINYVPKDTSITVCAGQKLCFKLQGRSPELGQKVLVSIVDTSQIKGASFTGLSSPTDSYVDTAFVTVCWQIPITTSGNKHFTLLIRDNHCPEVGTQPFTYNIKVLPSPDVNIGIADTSVACSSLPITVNPQVTGGAAPLKYVWLPTGATTTTIKASLGAYTLIVTGANGCADTVYKTFTGGLLANFRYDSVCVGIGQQFFDSSTSVNHSPDVAWVWNFGDGSPQVTGTPDPTHTFATAGTYKVTLTVTDAEGCSSIKIKNVTVGDIPQPDFTTTDPRCQNNPLTLVDKSKFVLPLLGAYASDGVEGISFKTPQAQPGFSVSGPPADYGNVSLTYTLTNVNGCVGNKTKVVPINPQPQVSILIPDTNIYAKCYAGWDTIMLAQAAWTTGDSLMYVWSDLTVSNLGVDSFFVKQQTKRTTSIIAPNAASLSQIKTTGQDIYTIYVVDDSGCYNSAKRTIFYPIIPSFNVSAYCHRSDTITFTDNSFYRWPLTKREWKFGDGSDSIYTTAPVGGGVVEHFYPYTGNDTIPVELLMIDATGCPDSVKGDVYRVLPDKNFIVTPDTLCYGQAANLQGPHGLDIYSWTWNLTQNNVGSTGLAIVLDTIFQSDSVVVDTIIYSGLTTIDKRKDTSATRTYAYTQPGFHQVNLNVVYNRYNGNSCDTAYTKTVFVHPNYSLVPSVTGRCARDTTSLSFSKVGGDTTAKTAVWQIYYVNASGGDSLLATDTSFNPKFVLGRLRNPKATRDNSGDFEAALTVTDYNGCQVTKDTTFTAIIVATPCFTRSDSCVNQGIIYPVLCNIDTFETYRFFYWDFGDSTSSSYTEVTRAFHQYLKPNENPGYTITYTISGDSGYSCPATVSHVMKVYPIPTARFVSDSVCTGLATLFNGSASTPAQSGDSIVGWHWFFTTLDSKDNPIHTDSLYGKNSFASYTYSNTGVDSAKLVVVNSTTGCTDTVSHSVFVKPKPKAAFGVDYNTLQAYKALDFIDSSQTGSTGLGEMLVKWKYYFGDGTTGTDSLPSNGNILHTYNAIAIDTAKEIVTNNFGCTDTTVRILDLHSYLVVPNAFTPSSGNVNSHFHLFYKGITDLKEYKVFNRYGEVVFDGTGDLTSYWDGTFHGDEQPIGVYVYYIVGTTVYGNDIYLKGNLTLIR